MRQATKIALPCTNTPQFKTTCLTIIDSAKLTRQKYITWDTYDESDR